MPRKIDTKRALKRVLDEMSDLPMFMDESELSVHSRSALGETPLHVAAVRGDVKVGRILLSCGADPNAKGEHGFTPLHEAVQQGNFDFARLLIASGASLSVRNDDGHAPLDLEIQPEDQRLLEFRRELGLPAQNSDKQ